MKNIGIVRNFDALGRIVVPKEIRKILEIEEGTPVGIRLEDNKIVIEKYTQKKCGNCGQAIDETDKFCKNCGKEI